MTRIETAGAMGSRNFTDHFFPIAGGEKVIADGRKVIPGHFYPISDHLNPTAGRFFPIADGKDVIARGKRVIADRKKATE